MVESALSHPHQIGGWAIKGLGGAVEIITRLDADGYDWSDGDLAAIGAARQRLDAVQARSHFLRSAPLDYDATE